MFNWMLKRLMVPFGATGTAPVLLPHHNIDLSAHDAKNKSFSAHDAKTKTFIARDKKNKSFIARA